MKDHAGGWICDDDIIVGPELPDRVFIDGSFCYQPVDLKDEIRSERVVLVFKDKVHSLVVVDNHLLGTVLRLPAFPEHLLGSFPCRCCTFENA